MRPPYSPRTGVPLRGGGLVDLPADCGDMQTLGYSWYYDWGLASSCPNVGVPFVPMESGDWCPGSSTCSAPAGLSASGSPYLLTFNEPDNPSQSNMTVARALQLWPYLETTGLQLGSPAVTDSSRGTAWLAGFMAGAQQDGYRVNFIAVHWYGNCSDPQSLVSYLAGLATYGLPLWLTEFSCLNGSAAVNAGFIQQVGPELEALPYLQRIGWFSNRPYPGGYENTGLLTASGTLSAVGQAYTALSTGEPGSGSPGRSDLRSGLAVPREARRWNDPRSPRCRPWRPRSACPGTPRPRIPPPTSATPGQRSATRSWSTAGTTATCSSSPPPVWLRSTCCPRPWPAKEWPTGGC